MANQKRTTEDLRETLFDTIDGLKNGSLEVKQAQAVCNVAQKIIETADLEIEYAKTYADIDKKELGISIGPVLLTGPKSEAQP